MLRGADRRRRWRAQVFGVCPHKANFLDAARPDVPVIPYGGRAGRSELCREETAGPFRARA